jgi:hypothetical protein
MMLAWLLLPFLSLVGAIDPGVTQATIDRTICVPGYATSVRPPKAVTDRVKRRLLKEAGLPPAQAKTYKLDHSIPLSLGGCARCAENMQLQPWAGPNGAHAKDLVENRMYRAVCAYRLSLDAAQACFGADWHTCP